MNIHTLYNIKDTVQFHNHRKEELSGNIHRIAIYINDNSEINIQCGVLVKDKLYWIDEDDILSSTTGPHSKVITDPRATTRVDPNYQPKEYQSKPRKKFCPNNACSYNMFSWCDGGDKYYSCGKRGEYYIGNDRKKDNGEDPGKSGAPALLHVIDLHAGPGCGRLPLTPDRDTVKFALKHEGINFEEVEDPTINGVKTGVNQDTIGKINVQGKWFDIPRRELHAGYNMYTATIGLDTPEVRPPMFH